MIPTSLLLLDFQNDFFSGGTVELIGAIDVAKKANALLQCFRDHGGHTIHVQHENRNNGLNYCIPGTEGIRIHDLVAHYENEPIVYKNTFDAFNQTNLDSILKVAQTSRLLICGMQLEKTIVSTARTAATLGYQVVIIHDACAAEDTATTALDKLRQTCKIQSIDQIMRTLSFERGFYL